MVNYFRDFIPSLSSYVGPLTDLTKKKAFDENGLEMTKNAISSFKVVKDQVAYHTSRVLKNASDPLILYADASTKTIGGARAIRSGDGAGTLRFYCLCEEFRSIPTW